MAQKNKDVSPGELRRRYLQAWRKRNPEKVKAYNRSYWERKAAAEKKRRMKEQADERTHE